MRPRGDAGRAQVADHLALSDLDARLHARCQAAHMAVGGLVAVGMTDPHVVAVVPFVAGLLDAAVASRDDRP